MNDGKKKINAWIDCEQFIHFFDKIKIYPYFSETAI